MAAILEAKAIVTAEDRTKAVFDAILARMEAVLKKGTAMSRIIGSTDKAISSAGSGVNNIGRELAASAQSLNRAARALDQAAGRLGRGGGGHSGGGGGHGWAPAVEHFGTRRGLNHAIRAGATSVPVVGGLGLAAGGVLIGEGLGYVLEKGAERQHERVRMDIAGMTPSEREAAETRAAQLAAKYPSISQTSVMHTLRNARAITGSYADAAAIADDVLKTRIVAQAARPGQDVEGDFDKLMKGLEQYGVTQDPAKFKSAMRDVQKVLAVEGDSLNANDIYQSFKYSRQALPGASQRFMLGAAPSIAQEMGGSSFGTAMSSFNRAVVTGRMDGQALKTAYGLGLVDKQDVVMKKGEPVRLKTALEGGHGIHGWKVAASDPDQWIYNVLAPALKAKGIVDPQTIMQIASIIFSNRMAGDLVDKFLTQRDRIEKNQVNLANAPNDPAARIMANDPLAAWQGVKNSFENLAAAVGQSAGLVTGSLNSMSGAINDWAAWLQGTKTDDTRRNENRDQYGINSEKDFSKGPVDDLVKAKQAQLAADEKHLFELKLQLKGLQDEQAKIAKMSWGDYLHSGRSKIADAALPFRMHSIEQQIGELETAKQRLEELGRVYAEYKAAAAHDPAGLLINSSGAAVPGYNHAAFPFGKTFGGIDETTGRNYGVGPGPEGVAPTGAAAAAQNRVVSALAPNPYGSLDGMSRAPIEAELKGAIAFTGTIKVDAGALEARLTRLEASSSNSRIKLNMGESAPDTAPGRGLGSH